MPVTMHIDSVEPQQVGSNDDVIFHGQNLGLATKARFTEPDKKKVDIKAEAREAGKEALSYSPNSVPAGHGKVQLVDSDGQVSNELDIDFVPR
ncbi:hypothetical protein ACIQU6_43675 [Streptomyces sp. NPDC090442]|uniref:hypothetical protein n=1 Tax=Streptomyces sp. NPDC090442 TaxID=3365962 RepID=UPI00380ED806